MLQNGIIFLFAISWCPAGPLIAVLCPEHVSGTSSHHGLWCLPSHGRGSLSQHLTGASLAWRSVIMLLLSQMCTNIYSSASCVRTAFNCYGQWGYLVVPVWQGLLFCPVRSPSCNNAVGYTEVPTCTLKLQWIIFFDILDNLCTNRGRGGGQLAGFF